MSKIHELLEIDFSVPPEFINLFEIDLKPALLKYCNKLIIRQCNFTQLMLNCWYQDYSHSAKSIEFAPKHLKPSVSEIKELNDTKAGSYAVNGAKKAISKMSQTFKERRILVTHLFQNKAKWHLFYFDQMDVEYRSKNHWKHGPHIHFVNYLWPNLTPKLCWQNLSKPKGAIGDNLHIRYLNIHIDPLYQSRNAE